MKPTILLISSIKDTAGSHMHAVITRHWQKCDMYHFDDGFESEVYMYQTPYYVYYALQIQQDSVYAQYIENDLQKKFPNIFAFLFLTKHASKSGIPSFCVHTQGNIGQNQLGGNAFDVAICPVLLKNRLFDVLFERNTFGFEVVHECTHHGPSTTIPSVFYEIGSTQTQWSNNTYAQFMYECLMQVLAEYKGESQSNAVAVTLLGGPHTCTNIHQLCVQKKVLLAHACANYALLDLTTEMILQLQEKTTVHPLILVDYKSLNAEQKNHVVQLLEQCNCKWEKLHIYKKNSLKTTK